MDTNDAILTLFSLIDQIANATKRTSTAEDQQVHGAFQIGNPGVRQAWSNAVNPSQDNRNHARAPSDGAHRYTFKGKSKGKGAMQGYGKGKGRSKGKGKGKRVFAQFAAPRTTGVKRCPAIGCTQLLTSKRDKTVCESCFRSSLTNPIQLTNGDTFPYRNAYKGKGSHKGPTRPPMQGKGKRSSPYPPRFRPPLLNVNHVELSWDQHVENGTGFISAPDSEVRGTMGLSPIRPPASKMHYSDDCWCGATSTCRTQEVGFQHEALGTSHIPTPIVPLSDQITLPTLQDDIETVQRMAAPAASRGSSSSDLTCRQVAAALTAQPPQGAMYGRGSAPSFAAAMRLRLIQMPQENRPTPTAPPAPGTVPGVVSRLDGNGGERLKGLEASLQRCKAELEELNEVQRERKGRDPRKHVKLLAIEDTRRQKEMVEARMVTLQGKIDKLTPPLPHTSPSPTVTRALGYREVHGDRTTWIDGAWPAEVPDPDPNPDPNPETVMTCCTCTSRHACA